MKTSTNIKLHGETLNAFSLRLGKLKKSTSTISVQHCTIGFIQKKIGKKEEKIQIGMKNTNLCLFADILIFCTENPKDNLKHC